METRRGAESLSFAEAIGPGRARVADSPGGVHRVFSYVERGFYAPQLRRALALFGSAQLHVLRTDRLWAKPEAELRRLWAFLGLPPGPSPRRRCVVPIDTRGLPPLEPALFDRLTAAYAGDIAATAALTGLDLSDWLDPGYREPMAGEGG